MDTIPNPGPAEAGSPDCALIGAGRLGHALATALPAVGIAASGPHGRSGLPAADRSAVVLLCVPDGEIAGAAQALPAVAGRLVGHCSGATPLTPITAAGHEAFSLHPLMTVTPEGANFAGAGAAVDGATPRALETATGFARALGMTPVRIADADRAAYHAAASIASNFLVTLEAAAERLAATATEPAAARTLLAPLVRASVENWARVGGRRALTGPIARGDEATVSRQRDTVAQRTPDLLPLFDVLADATRVLVREEVPA
jgi:predicted short-subunit dehydrogenase-like oxidoreductase (DUF2520 family)